MNTPKNENVPEPDSDKPLHYFAFSFQRLYPDRSITGSVYMGYSEQLVSIPRLIAAKVAAEMPADAILIGLGYMGFMTQTQMRTLT